MVGGARLYTLSEMDLSKALVSSFTCSATEVTAVEAVPLGAGILPKKVPSWKGAHANQSCWIMVPNRPSSKAGRSLSLRGFGRQVERRSSHLRDPGHVPKVRDSILMKRPPSAATRLTPSWGTIRADPMLRRQSMTCVGTCAAVPPRATCRTSVVASPPPRSVLAVE